MIKIQNSPDSPLANRGSAIKQGFYRDFEHWKIRILNLFRISILEFRIFKKGFTLIELLIYMGLLVVALGLSSTLLFRISTSDLQSSNRIELEENARLILSHLKLEIEGARSASQPVSDGQTSSVLVLGDSETVTFRLVSQDLVKEKEGTSNRLNSNLVKVDSVSFERLGDSSVLSDTAIRVTFQISPRSAALSSLVQTFEAAFILNL